MTLYSIVPHGGMLIATWPTGHGAVSHIVSKTLPLPPAEVEAGALAAALTDLSTCIWDRYCEPSSAQEDFEPNSEGWQRLQDEEALETLVGIVAHPEVPKDGMLVHSYNRVVECAHRVGRVLIAFGDPVLSTDVTTDIAAEIAAVRSAGLGDLRDRAQQAVALSRTDASPSQVAAAHELLKADPLSHEGLFTEVEPTAAAIAAAGWLHAAAQIAAEAADCEPEQVIEESDNIQALPTPIPTEVLIGLEAGNSAHDVVTPLVTDALVARRGEIPNLDELLGMVARATATADAHPEMDDQFEQLLPIRTTILDPTRPSLDLLEDLLTGIDGCFTLWINCKSDDDSTDEEDLDDDMSEEDYDKQFAEDRLSFATKVIARESELEP